MTLEEAVRELLESGGVDGKPLASSVFDDNPYQGPGTVAVRIEKLRQVAKAAEVSDGVSAV
ncbi:MAG: hypothetical protein E6R03_11150 [Hyphomicrobiaceae bacterium]|nr:MAG: hypothetical protein E6R03_11150 [Hyphomicrobiaceae bacterium]